MVRNSYLFPTILIMQKKKSAFTSLLFDIVFKVVIQISLYKIYGDFNYITWQLIYFKKSMLVYFGQLMISI
jgi:hypothetical protein